MGGASGFPIACAMSIAASALAFYVAFVEGGPSQRWRQHSWFRVVAASAGVYTAVNAVLSLPASEGSVETASRVSVMAAGIHVLAWYRYAEVDLRGRALRLRRALDVVTMLLVLAFAVPGVGLDGTVREHAVPSLGVVYHVATPTMFGRVVFAVLTLQLLRTALHYARAAKAGQRHAAAHALGLGALFLTGLNDALVASDLSPGPLLLDVGFCVIVATLGRVRSMRWAEDVHELDDAIRDRDAFVATVSHELRNPLNAILGWSELLGSKPTESRAKDLRRIRSNALTLAKLVEDLLDVSRLASGKLSLDQRETDLNLVVQTAIEVIRANADERGVRLVTELDESVGEVMADPARVQQIVWNLAANAVKFTPRDGTVTIRTSRSSQSVTITVTDTGEGIAEEHLPRIFERFRQVEGSSQRAHGGLGLGLSIVRDLVELHGGRVTVASDGPGRGSCFSVDLPVLQVSDQRQKVVPIRAKIASSGS